MSDVLIQTISYDDCTIGRLWSGKFSCFTLELPWLDNKSNISCIPEGRYRAKKHKSAKLGEVIHILDVDERTWIYIHTGNFTRQIEGCILVGSSITYLDKDGIPDVSNSKTAFESLMASLPNEFWVEIEREYHL